MTDLLRELGLELTPGDFSRSEFQNKFGENSPWYYDRMAAIANAILHERVKGAIKVVGGNYNGDGFLWSESYIAADTHSAYLLGVRELEGK